MFSSVMGSVVAEPLCIRVGTVSVVNGPAHCSVCRKVQGSMVLDLTIVKGRVGPVVNGSSLRSVQISVIGSVAVKIV